MANNVSNRAFITELPRAGLTVYNSKDYMSSKVPAIKPRAMTASYPKKKALLTDRAISGKSAISEKHKFDSKTVNSFKIAKETNNTRDVHIHLWRHIRKSYLHKNETSSSSRRWIF